MITPVCCETHGPIRPNIEKHLERHYEREASSQGAREFLKVAIYNLMPTLALHMQGVTHSLHVDQGSGQR